jgi:NAD(P)H-dependent FMN reductase
MKKIFAIVGSFRKGGNTDLIIDKVLEGASSKGAEVKKVFIDDLTIGSCQGCLDCRKEGQCSVKDDFSTIIEEMNLADGVVVGSPIYGNYMTGQLKILLDRMMGVINKVTYGPQGRVSETRLEKKLRNILIVMTAGAPNEDCADDSLKLIRRMFSSMTNNGFFDELIATNINPKGAIAMEIPELEHLAKLKGSKSPEEDAKVLKEANEKILERAQILGNQLVEGREDEESIDRKTMLTGNSWV